MTILKMENNVDFYLLACVLLLPIVFLQERRLALSVHLDTGSKPVSQEVKLALFSPSCLAQLIWCIPLNRARSTAIANKSPNLSANFCTLIPLIQRRTCIALPVDEVSGDDMLDMLFAAAE